VSNYYGYEKVFIKPIEMFSNKGNILIAISSSGKSMNILFEVEEAKSKGVKVITLTSFSGHNPLLKSGDINFFVPVDRYSHVEINLII
jgi:D-sedoheptulose 7-phosphate isomerase